MYVTSRETVGNIFHGVHLLNYWLFSSLLGYKAILGKMNSEV